MLKRIERRCLPAAQERAEKNVPFQARCMLVWPAFVRLNGVHSHEMMKACIVACTWPSRASVLKDLLMRKNHSGLVR